MSYFSPSTMILTADGEQPVEWLEKGVRVVTRDHGAQPLAAVLRVTRAPGWFAENPGHCPVELAQGGLDTELPAGTLTLTGNHRLLQHDAMSELYFGFNEVLVPFRAWGSGGFVRHIVPEEPVQLTFLLFEQHEIIQAEGVWLESFFPDSHGMTGIAWGDRPMVDKVMPNAHKMVTARRVLTLPEAELVVRPLERVAERKSLIA